MKRFKRETCSNGRTRWAWYGPTRSYYLTWRRYPPSNDLGGLKFSISAYVHDRENW